ncbi:hypothetical protein [Megalodesulfovibrio gigas]|uniref:hypothetical protein n=1 Tax=Megalodesulfovibrio gigas TaxID=879 RepID=UPI00040C8B90|nr:hypothetical protein [Megalodesulfovibrio gigas]
MNDTPLRLVFPCLHPAMCAVAPQGAVFLDPGLAPPPLRAGMCMPETLPMNRQMARACLAEMLAFGARFKKPGDMAYFSVAGMENFYDGTAMDIRDELEILAGQDNPGAKLEEKRLAAQRLLLLAWHLEEKRLEVRDAAETLRSLNLRFTSSVTEDEDLHAGSDIPDDPELARLVGELTPRELDFDPAAAGDLDWRRLAEAVLLLLPEGAELAICEPHIIADLGLTGPADLPGWRILGLTGPDAQRPWLDRPVRCHPPLTGDSGEAQA